MEILSRFGGWLARSQRRPDQRGAKKPKKKTRTHQLFETIQLEDRITPAIFYVTNTNATGDGSLAAAVVASQTDNDPVSVIDFENPATHAVTNGIIKLEESLLLKHGGTAHTVSLLHSGDQTKLVVKAPIMLQPGKVPPVTGDRVFSVMPEINAIMLGFTISGGDVMSRAEKGGGILNSGTLSLSDMEIKDNAAAYGGGIANIGAGSLTADDTTIDNNTAYWGGGVFNEGTNDGPRATASFVGCGIYTNKATSNDGGGILSRVGTSLTVTQSYVYKNQAKGNGGAIAFLENATGKIQDSTFVANGAGTDGGAIINEDDSAGLVTIQQCTFSSKNNATADGGGIAVTSAGRVTLTATTIAGSFAGGRGGGVFVAVDNALTIGNTIVGTNAALNDGPDIFGKVVSQGTNLVSQVAGAEGLVASDLTQMDPGLEALADNGGPTPTQMLKGPKDGNPGSPAIDAGNNILSPFGFDQRGSPFTRIVGKAVDIGAVEYRPPGVVPTAIDDWYTVVSGQTLTVGAVTGVVSNDISGSANPLSAVLNSQPTNGTVTLNSDGSFSYSPNANFYGLDTFTYFDSDGTNDSNIATVSINVIPYQPPVAYGATFTALGGQSLSVIAPGMMANDVDFTYLPLSAVVGTGPIYGNLTANADGSFTYTPYAGFTGTDSFTYHDTDGVGNSNVATVTINVAPIIANDEGYLAVAGQTLTVPASGVLANDQTVGNTTLNALLQSTTSNGVLTLDSDGSFRYTPSPGFSGIDSFTYKATDGTNNSNVATVSIDVIDPTPVASDGFYSVQAGQTLTVSADTGLLAFDSSPVNAPLTAVLSSRTSNGSLTLNADGSFAYTPNAGFVGTDTFTYTASDGTFTSNVATVSISVQNVTPSASNQFYSAWAGQTLSVSAANGLLTNAYSPTNAPLTAVVASQPSSGMLTVNADGSFTFTPAAGFTGTVTFTYYVTDGTNNSNIATVTLDIQSQFGGG